MVTLEKQACSVVARQRARPTLPAVPKQQNHIAMAQVLLTVLCLVLGRTAARRNQALDQVKEDVSVAIALLGGPVRYWSLQHRVPHRVMRGTELYIHV